MNKIGNIKKRFGCILTIFMILNMIVVTANATTVPKFGDADNNGVVDSTDSLYILSYSVGNLSLTDKQFSYLDVDNDEIVNSVDGLYVLKYSTNLIESFPKENEIVSCTNSLVVKTKIDKNDFLPSDFPEVDCNKVIIAKKTVNNNIVERELILFLNTNDLQLVEAAVNRIKQNPLVDDADLNYYADDIAQYGSKIKLNETSLSLNVGETAELSLDGSYVYYPHNFIGIDVIVNTDYNSEENIEELFNNFEITNYKAIQNENIPIEKTHHDFIAYDMNYETYGTYSPFAHYCCTVTTKPKNTMAYFDILDRLNRHDAVVSAQVIDDGTQLGGGLVFWSIDENTDVVNINLSGHQGSFLGGTVSNKGIITACKPGTVLITVEYYDIKAQCVVQVSD